MRCLAASGGAGAAGDPWDAAQVGVGEGDWQRVRVLRMRGMDVQFWRDGWCDGHGPETTMAKTTGVAGAERGLRTLMLVWTGSAMPGMASKPARVSTGMSVHSYSYRGTQRRQFHIQIRTRLRGERTPNTYSVIEPRSPDRVVTLVVRDAALAWQNATWSLMKSGVMDTFAGCWSRGSKSVACGTIRTLHQPAK